METLKNQWLLEVLKQAMPPYNNGFLSLHHFLKRNLTKERKQLKNAGEWIKLISKLKVNGLVCIE
jgi:hypothetical protein